MNLLRGVITGMLKEIGSPENQTFYTKVSPHAHIKLPFRFKKKNPHCYNVESMRFEG